MPSVLTELTFLQISGLFALFSLAIPVAIHLINPSKGRRIVVGSLALYRQAKKSKVTEFKISQWLLLLLRLAIFLLLALLLAQLVSSHVLSNNNNRVFLSSNWLTHSSLEEVTDVLTKHADADFFLLEEKLTQMSQREIEALRKRLSSEIINQPNWAALHQLFAKERAFKNPKSEDVFVSNAENQPLPSSQHQAIHLYATDLSIAYKYTENYQQLAFSPALTWHIKSVELANKNEKYQLNVAIVGDDSYRNEINAIEKAIVKLNQYRAINITVSHLSTEQLSQASLSGLNWLFWFNENDKFLLDSMATEKLNVISIAQKALMQEMKTRVQLPHYPFSTFEINQLAVISDIKNESKHNHHNDVLWQTLSAQPALTKRVYNKLSFYQFNFALTPPNTSLANIPEFPLILGSILIPNQLDSPRFSNGNISFPEDEHPQNKGLENKFKPLKSHQSLDSLLKVLVIILFILERLLAESTYYHRIKKIRPTK